MIRTHKNAQVFVPFNTIKLHELLAHHQVTEEGRRYIESSLAEPARNVQGTTLNRVSDTPCPKMGGNAQSESGTGEHVFTIANIFDPRVLGYVNQPTELTLSYRGRNNKKVRSGYTPDSLRFDWDKGVVLEEWKPASLRDHLEEKHPGKYLKDGQGQFTAGPIADLVNRWGIMFRVRFSDEICAISHTNRLFLLSYLYPEARAHYAHLLHDVLNRVAPFGSLSYTDLVESTGNVDTVNWALANGYLFFDWANSLLEREPDTTLVFSCAETLKAWSQSVRPDGARPLAGNKCFTAQDNLKCGDIFLMDGVRLTVSLVGTTGLHCATTQGQHTVVPFKQLEAAFSAGLVVLPIEEARSLKGSPIWMASPETLARSLVKLEIVQKFSAGQKMGVGEQYSRPTIYRWLKQIRQAEANGLSAFEALLDNISDRGYHGSHIETTTSHLLTELITKALSDEKSPSVHSSFHSIKKVVEAAGHTMIGKSAFYERVKKLRTVATVRQSKGHKHAYKIKPVYWMLDGDTPIHCTRAAELVHFDSTLLDIELRSSISGDVLGRPWLSIAICANTRRVMGRYLSFNSPGGVSSMMLLADIVRRHGRVPDAIVHDWGSEFKAKYWKFALTALGIERHVRPKSAPRFGAILERLFGVVTSELLQNLAGNTKLRKDVRSLAPSADPTTHSGLWLIDLAAALDELLFDIYDGRKHRATAMTPKAGFDVSFIKHGLRPHRLRRLQDLLPLLMPTPSDRPRVVDPSRGVWVNYRFYGHPGLANLSLKGTYLEVRLLPHDPGHILGYIGKQWEILKSNLSERLSRLSERARSCFYEEMQVEQRLIAAAFQKSAEKTSDLMETLNKKAKKNVELLKGDSEPDVAESEPTPVTWEVDHSSLPAAMPSKLSLLDKKMHKALKAIAETQGRA